MRYPYDLWLDQDEVIATWGKDYFSPTQTFLNTVTQYAKKHFLLVTVLDVNYEGKATEVTFRLERQFQDG